jgi:putative tricarboxylic transport membrane protein
MEVFESLSQGFKVMLSQYNLVYCALAACLGAFLAYLPGLSSPVVIALAFTLGFAFGLPPTTAIIVLVALCFGAQFGRTAAAVHRARGEAASAEAVASLAPIAIVALLSGAVAAIVAAAVVPLAIAATKSLGPAEITAFIIAFLAIAAALAPHSVVRALAAIIIGGLIRIMGSEIDAAVKVLSFGNLELPDGIDFVLLLIGMLLIPDLIRRLATDDGRPAANHKPAAVPRNADRYPTIVTATAANAGLSASFVPLLTLGLPVAVATALFGALLAIHGIFGGPRATMRMPEVVWGLFAAIIVANAVLLVVMLVAERVFARVQRLNVRVLAAPVLAFACFAAYSVNNTPFDVVLMLTYGIVSYLLFTCDYERYLLLMAFVLGPILRENIGRFSARGDVSAVVNRPIAGTVIIVGAIAVVAIGTWRMQSRKAKTTLVDQCCKRLSVSD